MNSGIIMANRLDGWHVWWPMGLMVDGMMADSSDSERLRDFDDGWTGRQTEICDARVAFETEKLFKCLLEIAFVTEVQFKV